MSLKLYAAEALRVHELLDAQGVPRTHDGEPLSMSQRVEHATQLLALYARQFGRHRPLAGSFYDRQDGPAGRPSSH